MKYLILLLFPCIALSQTQIGNDIFSTPPSNSVEHFVATSNDGSIVAISTAAYPGAAVTNFVRVYENVNDEWIQIGSDISGSNEVWFGKSIAISGDGETLAIGTPRFVRPNVYMDGRVDVYTRVNNEWVQEGSEILGMGVTTGEAIGWSVSLNDAGNKLAIGSRFSSGFVRVFENVNGNWDQLGNDITHVGGTWDGFGEFVSFSSDGNRIAISTNTAGYVATYEYDNNDWIQYGSDVISNGLTNNPISLSCDGNTLAIGDSLVNNWDGEAKIFTYVNGNWVQKGSTISGTQFEGQFGFDVSISCNGNVLVVSELSSGINGYRTGSVYVYQFLNGNWQQIGNRIDGSNPGDHFGLSISLSSNAEVLAIGGWTLSPVRMYDLTSILNVDDNSYFDSVLIYPNPAKNYITISTENNVLLEKAILYSTNGKLVLNIEPNNLNTKMDVDVSNLNTGVYILKLIGEESNYITRFIKE